MVRFFLCLICCLSLASYADERSLNFKGEYRLAPFISYIRDTPEGLLIDDLLAEGNELTWTKNSTPEVNLGFVDSPYWFHVKLVNRNPDVKDWLFEIAYPLLDHVELFLVDSQKQIQKYHLTGDRYPTVTKDISHPNWVYPLTLKEQESYDLYVYVESSGSLQVPMRVWQWESFSLHTMVHYGLQGLFFGMVFIMAIYNFMLWFSERQRLYLVYVGYISAISLFLLTMNGLGFLLVWPNMAFLNAHIVPFSLALLLASLLHFLKDFFVLKDVDRRINDVFKLFVKFHIFAALSSFILPYNSLVITLLISSSVSLALAIFITLLMLKLKHPSAHYFVAAWTSFLLGGLMLILNKVGVLPINILTENGLQFGASLEVMILSLALADRMASSQKERIRIQDDRFKLIRRLHTEKEKAYDAEKEKLSLEKKYSANLESEVVARTEELQHTLSELEHANERLKNISITDALTGLNNRRRFDESWQREYKRAHREHSVLSLIMMDIDFFKKVNDEFGHPAGDMCLQEVAKCIQIHAGREFDITARYGGEEFAIVLPATDKVGAIEVANNIRRHVESLQLEWEGKNIRLTICAGICSQIPTDTDYLSRDAMLQRADKALYEAKRSGRNREVHYDDLS